MSMNIAIFSPNQNPYSETFIQAHKKYLKDQIFYYYGRGSQIRLETKVEKEGKLESLLLKIYLKIFKKSYSELWVRRILRSLAKNKVNAILIEYGTHAFHLLPILRKTKIPIIVHFHGYDASRQDIIEKCNYYSEVFDLSRKVISVSTEMHQKLVSIGCNSNKLIYNVYGPNPKFSDVKPTFSQKQFISVGRFTDKKAPYYTILAFKEVLKKHPDAVLLMAGDGELLNSCVNLVRHYNMEENIKFLGVINSDAFANYLCHSIAYVQHSITALNGDMEGTPLSILESSAAGIPVISTYHAGISDVIEHEVTGLLCEEHDILTMSKHMLKVLENKDYAKEIGLAGKWRIKENFSLKRHIDTLQASFHEIVK